MIRLKDFQSGIKDAAKLVEFEGGIHVVGGEVGDEGCDLFVQLLYNCDKKIERVLIYGQDGEWPLYNEDEVNAVLDALTKAFFDKEPRLLVHYDNIDPFIASMDVQGVRMECEDDAYGNDNFTIDNQFIAPLLPVLTRAMQLMQ